VCSYVLVDFLIELAAAYCSSRVSVALARLQSIGSMSYWKARHPMRQFLLVTLSLAACSTSAEREEAQEPPPIAVYPIQPAARLEQSGSTSSRRADAPASGGSCATSIGYHGGPVMTNAIKVYLIWYGSWAGNSAQTIIPDMIRTLGGSPRWKIDTTFTNGGGTAVNAGVQLAGQFNDAYSQGSALSQGAVFQVVRHAFSGGLPVDPSGVYYVLTSADVSQTNSDGTTFCGNYCGWHTWQSYLLFPIKFSFVGNGDRCPSSCISSRLDAGSPNGNRGADGMASVIVHELDETATDPQINAWYTSTPNGICENADNCAWTFGGTWPSANGSTANAHLGGRDFLIQRDWANYGTGYCTTSWAGTCDGTAGQWSGCRGTGCNVGTPAGLVGGSDPMKTESRPMPTKSVVDLRT